MNFPDNLMVLILQRQTDRQTDINPYKADNKIAKKALRIIGTPFLFYRSFLTLTVVRKGGRHVKDRSQRGG